MASELLNTLFVMTEGSWAHLDSETVRVEKDGVTIKQTPLMHLGSIVLFGLIGVSPYLMRRCAEDGRAITFLDTHGRFLARVEGRTTGNVLLRKAQFESCQSKESCAAIASDIVRGKLQNSRNVLARAAREIAQATGARAAEHAEQLRQASAALSPLIQQIDAAADLDSLRGLEGHGASVYFDAFDAMIREQRTDFQFSVRSRRPPRDRVNALLSFIYALMTTDCRGALEGVGLDSQFGFLHAIRPGRPALSLDLAEEFRAPLADRLALTLINRKEIDAADFEVRPGHSVLLTTDGRKKVIVAYQKRKQTEIEHPLLKTKVALGLMPHVQARVLARRLRGDIPAYVPFVPR